MATMTLESAVFAPRRAARRHQAIFTRPAQISAQPIAPAISARNEPARPRMRLGLAAVTGITIALHAAIIVAIQRHAPAIVAAKPQQLAIELAPPKVEPPPPPTIVPKPVAAPKLPAPAPSTPVVRDAPVESAPSAEAVPVAVAAPPAPPAPPAPAPEVVTEPRGYIGYLRNPAPTYPPAAQNRGLQGQVVLKVYVLASGQAGNVSVAKSSGHNILDDAAIKAVATWVFQPAKRGQTPIDGWVQVPLSFKLS